MTSGQVELSQINKALAYPYPRPEQSFCLKMGKIFPLTNNPDFSGRTPVIACGSNGSPEQLIRKFGSRDQDDIYVTRALLSDFLCTYSAHITAYGSIPATIAPFPGHQTDCHITWLDNDQLSVMHESEALGVNYRYSKLDHIRLKTEFHAPLASAFAYISLHGSLCIEGAPVEISGISNQSNYPVKRMTQAEIQKSTMTYLKTDYTLEEFVAGNINNAHVRMVHTNRLKAVSRQFAFEHEYIQRTK
jgi:hypothetical protein